MRSSPLQMLTIANTHNFRTRIKQRRNLVGIYTRNPVLPMDLNYLILEIAGILRVGKYFSVFLIV